MKKTLTNLLIFMGLASTLQAQITGGQNSFEFLRLPASARLTALGGYQIAVQDDDVNLALSNPAALNPLMNHHVSFSHNFMVSDISSGYVGFGQELKKLGVTMHGGIQYLNYGDFVATDEIGTETGSFNANEYAFTVGAGRQLYEPNNMHFVKVMGVGLKIEIQKLVFLLIILGSSPIFSKPNASSCHTLSVTI